MRKAYVAALLASVTAFPAYAQDTTTETDAEFIGTVTLGESRRGVQTDVAVSETVISQEEIEARQATTTAELLDTVPNVALINANVPHGSSVSIRGLGAQAGVYATDGKVAVVVNGVASSSEEVYRNGAMLALEPELFREVKVQRGPAESFQYSSGAMGGTIEAQTKSARDFLTDGDTFALRQKFGYDSNAGGALSTTILSFAPDDRFDMIAFYGYREADDRVDGDGNTIESTGFTQKSALLEANYKLSDASSLTFHISKNDLPQFDVPYSAFNADFSSVRVNREVEDTTAYVAYKFAPLDTDLVNLEARLTYKQEDMTITSATTSSDIYNTAHSNTRVAFNLSNEALFSLGATSHSLTTGVEVAQRTRTSEELAGTYAGYNARSAPGGTDDSLAVYIADEITYNRLTVTPQLRFEKQTLTSDGNDYAYATMWGTSVAAVADGTSYTSQAWTGALSAKYDVTDAFAVFGTVAYNENLPILDDLRNSSYIEQSEKGQTAEIGLSYDSMDVFAGGDALRAKLTLFQTKIWDGTTYSGIDSVDLRGGEIELSYAHPAFYADFNYGQTRGTVNGTSDYFNYAPADQAMLTLGKRFMDDQLDLAVEIEHNWAQTRTSTTSTDSATSASEAYTLANLSASYTPNQGSFEGMAFQMGVDNLFNETYHPYLATNNGSGRTFKVSIAKTF